MKTVERILVTTSRMPFAVDEIRKLGGLGYAVDAADTYGGAAGSHSRHVHGHFTYPPPRQDPFAFVMAVGKWCAERDVRLIVPTFEEAFYLRRADRLLPATVHVFAPELAPGLTMHNKAHFLAMARERGLPVPPTRVVRNRIELKRAIVEMGEYFARPVLSRGAIDLLTNVGPRSGDARVDDCDVSEHRPWLVQPFVAGDEVCGYGIAYRGHLLAHVSYRHPRSLPGRGGITFESMDDPEILRCARAVVEATGYTGQFGLDFIVGPDGLVLSECNARATAGVSLLPARVFARSILTPSTAAATYVCPPGRTRKITAGLLLDVLQSWHNLPDDLRAWAHGGRDLYGPDGDRLPALYAFLSLSHVRRYRRQMPDEALGTWDDVVRAQFYDIAWDEV